MQSYVTKSQGVYRVITSTCCTKRYCIEYGCDFPNCATYTPESFTSIEEAKKVYPDVEEI